MKNHKKGFTLIELLIVIAIIAILAAIIFVAVDPAKRGKQSRNAQRSSEVNSVLNAVLTYGVDYNVSDFETELGITGTPQTLGFLSSYLVDEFISEIPTDPQPDVVLGGYKIEKSDKGRIKVTAPSAEGETIEVSR